MERETNGTPSPFLLPDCSYQSQLISIPPCAATPKRSVYLSNLDDQNFLRFSIKYVFLFEKAISFDALKHSLSRVLVDYYPLAGRLRTSKEDDRKFEIYCNGVGALFSEAFMDITVTDFLACSCKPNASWKKLLLYQKVSQSFLDIPPLVIQATNLKDGGLILCTAINHCFCDGIGSSQFMHAWANDSGKWDQTPPVRPIHDRYVFSPRKPPRVSFKHEEYASSASHSPEFFHVTDYLRSQSLSATSITFTEADILKLKQQIHSEIVTESTIFEVLASHTWRSWVESLSLSPSSHTKLLFSVNVRQRVLPTLPAGYYGNGFVLGCAESCVGDLIAGGISHGVRLVQEAKSKVNDDYVRSVIDLLEDKKIQVDLCRTLVISGWSRLGLEDLDFGQGRALFMGPLISDIYCLFLPVVGDHNAVRVLVSLPEKAAILFQTHMTARLSRD